MRDGGRMGGPESLYLSGTVDELLHSRVRVSRCGGWITTVARATKLGKRSGSSIQRVKLKVRRSCEE